MQAFLLSAVCQDFQPPDRAEGVQPEQVKLLTCLKAPASPIHTRHIPRKACRNAGLFAFCRMEELLTRYSSNQLRYLSVLLTTKHYDN